MKNGHFWGIIFRARLALKTTFITNENIPLRKIEVGHLTIIIEWKPQR